MKKVITLIVLVITIIVIIILAGAIVLDLVNNISIAQSSTTTFKDTVNSYNSELSMALSNQYATNLSFKPISLNAGTWDGTDADVAGSIRQYLQTITKEDAKKFEIRLGKLTYVGNDPDEEADASSIGVANVTRGPLFNKVYTGISGILSYHKGATCDANGVITLPPMTANGVYAIQRGPYEDLEEGTYQVIINGENLDSASLEVSFGSAFLDNIVYLKPKVTTNTATQRIYTVKLVGFTPRFETVMFNRSVKVIKINNIEIKQLSY